MALPTSLPSGHRLSGTDMQGIIDEIGKLRLFVAKTSDGSAVNNSTTLQNDPQLFQAVEANSTYKFWCHFLYGSLVGADIKFGWTAPSGSTMTWTGHSVDPAGSYFGDIKMSALNIGDVADHAGGGAVPVTFKGSGTLRTSAAAGNLQLQWAQLAATVGDTWVYAQSDLLLTKVA